MGQKLFAQLIYALLSGFTEFLPVSAFAHQRLFCLVFGLSEPDLLLSLGVHVGSLAAVLLCSKNRLARFSYEKRLAKHARRGRRNRKNNTSVLMDARLFGTAMVPVILSSVALLWSGRLAENIAVLSLLLLVNGLVLFMPRLLRQGNKDGRSLSRLDAIILGIGGSFGVVPGFSRIGCVVTAGAARGTQQGYALDMALLLSIPGLIGLVLIDVYALIVAGAAISGIALLIALIGAAISLGVGILAIMLIRYVFLKSDGLFFAYYSWSLALFTFVLYLIIQ